MSLRNPSQPLLPICLALLVFGLMFLPGTSATAGSRPPSQVVVEFGYVNPYGDLADDFSTTEKGFGIKSGIEMGFRWRYYLSGSLSISPSFHFVDYKNYSGENDEIGAYRIKPTTLLYGLELLFFLMDEDTTLRPFVGGSAAICRNRTEGYWKTWDKAFDASVNSLGFGLRAGVQVLGFEFSAVYNVNRFETWRFFNTGYEENYDWDNLVIRAGWIIPF
jgi:hypothetical protein